MPKSDQKPVGEAEDGMPVYGYNARGEPICNSPLRGQPGKFCKAPKGLNRGNGRCGMHGGPTPRGTEAGAFQTGEYSRYIDVLPPDTAKRVRAHIVSGNLLSLEEDIGVAVERVRAAMKDALCVPPGLSKKAREAYDETFELLTAGEYDEDDTESHLRGLLEVLGMILDANDKGDLVEKRQEHLRKLTDTENKRQTGQTEQMSVERVMVLFLAVEASVREHGMAQRRYLQEHYPQILRDPLFPNMAHLLMSDLASLLGPNGRRMRRANALEDDYQTIEA